MKNRKGFTLIELLAVILILGIIMLIAIPTVNSVIRESRMGAWKSTGNQMVNSAEVINQTCQLNSDCKPGDILTSDNDLLKIVTSLAADASDRTETALKAKLDIKGDVPKISDGDNAISIFYVDGNGDAHLKFTMSGFTCSNEEESNESKIESGKIKVGTLKSDGVACKVAS